MTENGDIFVSPEGYEPRPRGPKDALFPLVQKRAAFYLPVSLPEHRQLFPSLTAPLQSGFKDINGMGSLAPDCIREIASPKTFGAGLRLLYLSPTPHDISQAYWHFSVVPGYFAQLPDLLNPVIGWVCSDRIKTHLEAAFPDAASFFEVGISNAETGAHAPVSYFRIVPRWQLVVSRARRKEAQGLPPAHSDCAAVGLFHLLQSLPDALAHLARLPMILNYGFGRELFVSLKQAGFTGLDEVPMGREHQTIADTIGHVYF